MSGDSFYHATTKEAAQGIRNNGFQLRSNSNHPKMFGQGHYFTRRPVDAILKVDSNNKCEVIIEVKLNTGRMRTERYAHPDWNSSYAYNNGFDSVQMDHCQTGIEICVYDQNRITIVDIYYFKEKRDNSGNPIMVYESNSYKTLEIQIPNCTYTISGRKYMRQLWFICRTCQLDPFHGNKGCCTQCAKYCHAGHDVVCVGIRPRCFCDCGAESGRGRKCQCLH